MIFEIGKILNRDFFVLILLFFVIFSTITTRSPFAQPKYRKNSSKLGKNNKQNYNFEIVWRSGYLIKNVSRT